MYYDRHRIRPLSLEIRLASLLSFARVDFPCQNSTDSLEGIRSNRDPQHRYYWEGEGRPKLLEDGVTPESKGNHAEDHDGTLALLLAQDRGLWDLLRILDQRRPHTSRADYAESNPPSTGGRRIWTKTSRIKRIEERKRKGKSEAGVHKRYKKHGENITLRYN